MAVEIIPQAEVDALCALNVGAIPTWHAARRPGAMALTYRGDTMDFATLDARSNRVANGLLAAGLPVGARIALLDRNADTFVEVFFGAAKTGICLVALNFRLAPPELAFQLGDAEAEILFTSREFVPTIQQVRAGLPHLKRVIVLDDDYPAWRDTQPATPSQRTPAREDVVLQMYTSGTTGRPKGVELTHANMMLTMAESRPLWPFVGPGAPAMTVMPLFHIAGINFITTPMTFGAGVILLRDAEPRLIAEALSRHQVAVTPLPPVLIQALLDLAAAEKFDFPGLKLILVAGSAIPLELLQRGVRELGVGFGQGYGLTETCGGLSYLRPEDMDPNGNTRMKSGGRPFGAAKFRIVDESDQDVPPGATGEIVCQSPRIMKGYWKRPDATAEAMRGGWFHTGDAGFFDEEGYVHIVDRIKDMVISGGENIYPAEIEFALFAHPGVHECAVIGVPDEKWGEALLAFVVRRPGSQVGEEELVAHLRTKLAGYKIPRRYAFVDTLPRNATGKVTKWALREEHWRDRERRVN